MSFSKRYRGRHHSWCIRTLVRRDGSACFSCGRDLLPREMTIDHKIPLSRGGSDSIENMEIACEPCNREKGCMTAEEWAESGLAVQ
jgi:5-methylcytosine-specific restriction endonuclease McrA